MPTASSGKTKLSGINPSFFALLLLCSSAKPEIWKQQWVQTTAHGELGSGGSWPAVQNGETTHSKSVIYSHRSQWESFSFSGVGWSLHICFQPNFFLIFCGHCQKFYLTLLEQNKNILELCKSPAIYTRVYISTFTSLPTLWEQTPF